MLTTTEDRGGASAAAALQGGLGPAGDASLGASPAAAKPGVLARAMRLEWLGQTVASLCWIVSVFVYGISSAGDWLQLCAASAWFVANIAALVSEAD